MIGLALSIAALAQTPTPPADQAYISCAFQRAGELATASDDSPEAVADRVVEACAPAGGEQATMSEATRQRVRLAAIAVVNRRRGLDGQPSDAPIRLPSFTETRMASLDIPDEIAPAILPYMSCRLASAGVPLRSSRDGPIEQPTAAIGDDCSARRDQAARRAEAMLREQRGGTRSERRDFVERVLRSVDDFVSNDLAPPPEAKTDAED